MTAPDPRLLVPASSTLLQGWCGPVRLDTEPGVLVLMAEQPHAPCKYDLRSGNGDGCLHRIGLKSGRVSLDLSRAECRDRVVRVLAAELFRNVPPNGDGFSWRHDADDRWEIRSHTLGWMAAFAADTSNWFARDEGNRSGRFPSRSVPALAGLSADDTRLPDGSRLVDALALAAVARHVLGGAP